MMPSRISSRTGRTMANSTITAPRSSRLSLGIIGLLRASDRLGLRERASSDARSRCSQRLSVLAELGGDVGEEAVDLTAEREHGEHDEDGDAGHEDAVLDHRGALVVLAVGGNPSLKERDDA